MTRNQFKKLKVNDLLIANKSFSIMKDKVFRVIEIHNTYIQIEQVFYLSNEALPYRLTASEPAYYDRYYPSAVFSLLYL